MMFLAFVSWWYGAGWQDVIRGLGQRLRRLLGFFSVGLLLRTLFDPFRQIDAGGVRGGLDVQMRAFFDRLFSRFVGLFVRSAVVLFGLFMAVVALAFGLCLVVVWPFVPVLPLLGLILMMGASS